MICRILLLIILTSCVSGSFVVNVTQSSYQAEENHNITLEWTFTTKPDSPPRSQINILCSHNITGHNTSVLYHVHEGVEVSESHDAKFSGRVQSDKDALREGRIRLQLSRLRTDDSGLYLCEVNTDYGFSVGRCRLNVTAAADQVQTQRTTERPRTENSTEGAEKSRVNVSRAERPGKKHLEKFKMILSAILVAIIIFGGSVVLVGYIVHTVAHL